MQIIHVQRGDFSNQVIFPGQIIIDGSFTFEKPVSTVYAMLQGFDFSLLDSDRNLYQINCEVEPFISAAVSNRSGTYQLKCTFSHQKEVRLFLPENAITGAFSFLIIGV